MHVLLSDPKLACFDVHMGKSEASGRCLLSVSLMAGSVGTSSPRGHSLQDKQLQGTLLIVLLTFPPFWPQPVF